VVVRFPSNGTHGLKLWSTGSPFLYNVSVSLVHPPTPHTHAATATAEGVAGNAVDKAAEGVAEGSAADSVADNATGGVTGDSVPSPNLAPLTQYRSSARLDSVLLYVGMRRVSVGITRAG